MITTPAFVSVIAPRCPVPDPRSMRQALSSRLRGREPRSGGAATRWKSRGQAALLPEDHAIEVALGAPRGDHFVEGVDAGGIDLGGERAGTLGALVVVVAGRAGLEERPVVDGEAVDRLHPRLLRLDAGLDGERLALLGLADDVGDMPRLVVEHRGHVHRQAVLRD